MRAFRANLNMLPTISVVEQEAQSAHPGEEIAAIAHECGMLRAYYRMARNQLEALVIALERFEAEPPDEDDDEDDDSTVDYGGEGHIEAAIYDDPEACDVGRTPCPARDVTRHDLRGATV